MKAVLGATLALFTVLSACSKADERKGQGPPPVPEAAKKADGATPYYSGLIEEYKTLLAEDPTSLAAVVGLGNAYYDSGRWKEAVVAYEQALRLDPRNADIRTDLGTCYRNLGLPDQALAAYHEALTFEPGHINARYNIGIVYAYDKKDLARAIPVWEELLRLAPNHPHADHIKAFILSYRSKLKGTAHDP